MFFNTNRDNLDALAANLFVEMVKTKSCPPSSAAKAAYDYAEAFFRERNARGKKK